MPLEKHPFKSALHIFEAAWQHKDKRVLFASNAALYADDPILPKVETMLPVQLSSYSGDSNLIGFVNILKGCRQTRVEHWVYASSLSVYRANTIMSLSVHQNADHSVSLYTATKGSGELMSHNCSRIYSPLTTGLRFVTIYRPWGCPDVAMIV